MSLAYTEARTYSTTRLLNLLAWSVQMSMSMSDVDNMKGSDYRVHSCTIFKVDSIIISSKPSPYYLSQDVHDSSVYISAVIIDS